MARHHKNSVCHISIGSKSNMWVAVKNVYFHPYCSLVILGSLEKWFPFVCVWGHFCPPWQCIVLCLSSRVPTLVCVCLLCAHLHRDVIPGGQALAHSSEGGLLNVPDAPVDAIDGQITLTLPWGLVPARQTLSSARWQGAGPFLSAHRTSWKKKKPKKLFPACCYRIYMEVISASVHFPYYIYLRVNWGWNQRRRTEHKHRTALCCRELQSSIMIKHPV